ncbi:unnamed protein product [Rhodiola kirilowii]
MLVLLQVCNGQFWWRECCGRVRCGTGSLVATRFGSGEGGATGGLCGWVKRKLLVVCSR